jgi:hypothetical protein
MQVEAKKIELMVTARFCALLALHFEYRFVGGCVER